MKTKNNYSPENLGFGSLGNGITVYDRTRERNGDFITVAHISTTRVVEYYKGVKISQAQKDAIEHFAKTANPRVSITQDEKVFRIDPI